MTFSANGAFPGQTEFSGGGTVPLSNQKIGDLITLIAASVDSITNYVTSIAGGGANWTQIGTPFYSTHRNSIVTTWQGEITATGAQAATVTVTGGSPTIGVVSQEFFSSVGSWSIDEIQYLDSTGTSVWPTLTPSGANELYFGFAIDSGIASAGSTPGFVYNVTTHQDGCAWNTGVSAPSAPVWADSGQLFGAAFLVKEAAVASSGSGLLLASGII